jgi:hypothetical protein
MMAALAVSTHRLGSFVLLAAGVLLVFAGLSGALGFSPSGIVASAAAIAALLYAGGVWFGASPRIDASVVLFTPSLTVAAGPLAGRDLVDLFPIAARKEIALHCRAALAGQSSRFVSGASRFEAAPVKSADGLVVYGILISGAPAPAPEPAQAAAG